MIRLKVWGNYAAFNRPELKVERFTYDIMTPSAARNILQSIYWHPCFDYIIDKIYIMKPIQKMSIKRNELKNKIDYKDIKESALKTNQPTYLPIRQTQRNAVVLKDVEYIIEAHFIQKGNDPVFDNDKIYALFCKRAKSGKCFKMPFLGNREYSCFFEFIDNNEIITPENINLDLGIMLYDIEFNNGTMKPYFFNSKVNNGILDLTKVEVLT